jgi:prepilin-type N-terminal cleavage/methylation domain-containing protein
MRRWPTSAEEIGFTLIEMLVVLTVIGLLAALLSPSIFRKPAYLVRERVAAELEAQLTRSSGEAQATGHIVELDLTKAKGASDTGFVAAIGTVQHPILYPDGSSNGGVVSLSGRPLLQISWLDTRVSRAAR